VESEDKDKDQQLVSSAKRSKQSKKKTKQNKNLSIYNEQCQAMKFGGNPGHLVERTALY
jgi:hypothetical protein